MAEIKTEQEPSIEEILESIRQIISEDGKPVAPPEEAAPPPRPAPKPAPPPEAAKPAAPPPQPPKAAVPPPAPKAPEPPKATPEPILDLTDKVEEEEAQPAAKPQIVMEEIEAMESPLMSEMTEETAVALMSRILAQNLAVERELPGKPGPVTLEDMAREIMHPLIKVWLDKNLPLLIEKLVAREIEKLAHRAMDK